ncbi:putative aldouronate transport system substrate-binding protein [Paenibacillus anaericanus]|uniref:extracellular solute-binding protein n=1 Tax=Paenibacillus anaericanus TaxID=170367 RepID=UPI00277E0084|nr:extracellular solute-binding protein [Paenibacillus anaericanus]MDQ0089140.1 putative aldouronate transport system substrate-binding protein [Paenibacillus anaericanus]
MKLTKLFLSLSLILAFVLSLSSCQSGAQSGEEENLDEIVSIQDDPIYGVYDNQVVVRVGFMIPDSKLMAGDTNDNNPVTRYLEEITNIKVIHAWEAKGDEAYAQKVDLAIDSEDIPDAMVVTRNQLMELIKQDKIEDLTTFFEQYGSELIKEMYDSTEGVALAEATFNHKLYGLPNVAINADSPTLLWIRQDWLDRLNLQAPQSLEDIEEIAKAFIERDPDGDGKMDTIGLTGYKGVVYGTKPQMNGYDAIFNTYHAFPKNWVKDNEGNIIYGSIAPENKEALAKLADWYKRGLIDKQFALNKETWDPIIAGRAGMFFGPWWAPYWPLVKAVSGDTKSEWRAFAAPLDVEGKFVTHMAPVTDRYLVVRKGYEHPEAVIKLLNAFTRLERGLDPNKKVAKLEEFAAQLGIQTRAYYPFDLLIDYSDAIEKRYAAVQQALHGKLDPETLDANTRQIYNQWVAEKENPKKDMEGWKSAIAYEYGVGILASTPMEQVRSVYYGTTLSMNDNWANLEKLENETFLNIIVGDLPISAFDEFVADWKRLGGDQITGEVTKIVENSK